jgi:hypothetical protein
MWLTTTAPRVTPKPVGDVGQITSLDEIALRAAGVFPDTVKSALSVQPGSDYLRDVKRAVAVNVRKSASSASGERAGWPPLPVRLPAVHSDS